MKIYRIAECIGAGLMACAFAFTAAASTKPLRINPSGSAIYGFLGWAPQPLEGKIGWYEVGNDGSRELIWLDSTLGATASYFTSAWLRQGKLCGTFGNRSQMFYMEFNPSTGESMGYQEIDLETEPENILRYMWTSAWSSKDDFVYGFAHDRNLSHMYLVKAPASDRSDTHIVREVPEGYTLCRSLCFNLSDNHFYGIDMMSRIVRFDQYGNFEHVADVNLPDEVREAAGWSSGMTYSPLDECFYWNAQYADYGSSLVRIDASTYACEKISELDIFDLYTVMCCEDHDGNHGSGLCPESPVLRSFSVNGDDIELEYILPGQADGSIPSPLTCHVYDNGKPAAVIELSDGHPGRVTLTALSNGYHTFRARIEPGSGEAPSSSTFDTFWIGADVPESPAGVSAALGAEPGTLTVSWAAPENGAHRGRIDQSSFVYRVYLDSELQCETTSTEALLSYPLTDGRCERVVSVTAVYEDKESEAGHSNPVVTGEALFMPVELLPSQEDESNVMYVGANGAQSKWELRTDFKGDLAFYCPTDRETATDDYLMLPPISMTDMSVKKRITLDAGNGSNIKKNEYIELWIGERPTPASVRKKCIMPKTQVQKMQYTALSSEFMVPAPGNYHIAVRCVSDKNMSGVYIRNIRIEDTDTPSGVDQIEDAGNGWIQVDGGSVVFHGYNGKPCAVYTSSGTLVRSIVPTCDQARISLDSGLYIVKADATSLKVKI